MLDKPDKRIISELQKDGRTPLSHIGEKVGMFHVAVRKRLKLKVELLFLPSNGLIIPFRRRTRFFLEAAFWVV